jgi:hypothetical protein
MSSRPHLLVLSEYLPHSTEEDIQVDQASATIPRSTHVLYITKLCFQVNLFAPDPSSVIQLDGELEDPDDILTAVLSHSALRLSPHSSSSSSGEMTAFLSAKTHNLLWAKWLQPRETVRFNYKYRILWPEAKGEVYIN